MFLLREQQFGFAKMRCKTTQRKKRKNVELKVQKKGTKKSTATETGMRRAKKEEEVVEKYGLCEHAMVELIFLSSSKKKLLPLTYVWLGKHWHPYRHRHWETRVSHARLLNFKHLFSGTVETQEVNCEPTNQYTKKSASLITNLKEKCNITFFRWLCYTGSLCKLNFLLLAGIVLPAYNPIAWERATWKYAHTRKKWEKVKMKNLR